MVNYISGNDSNNTINGTINRDRLYGFGGNDTLLGNNGDDALFAGSGNDLLFGGSGRDWLQGGTGSSSANDFDTLDGGIDSSTDYYVLGNQNSSYYTGAGYAILRNYNAARDFIVVADNVSNSQIRLSLGQVTGGGAADTLIRINGELVGIVEDVNIASLPLGQNFIRSNQVNQNIWL